MQNKFFFIILFFLIFFMTFEHFFPLRKRRDSNKRLIFNFSLSLLALPITRFLSFPLVFFVASFVDRHQLGLFHHFKLNATEKAVLSFLILDYTLYWWHLANHKINFLWRFHQVHHTDFDMDATTALRFHFGELILSSAVRCCLIFMIGLTLKTVLFFDAAVTSAALFHHSNLKLPLWIENFLRFILVTPLYHQNHHSYYLEETNSNFSTILSFWDRLHFSLTISKSPNEITIGHPGFIVGELTFLNLVTLPLRTLRHWPHRLFQRKSKQDL